MSANAKLMEALLRIEHKLDLVLDVAKGEKLKDILRAVGDPGHFCSLCTRLVEYHVDVNDAVVVRKCGCSTGKVALDMKAFAPPVKPARKTDDGTDQEDRSDPDRGGGSKRR